MPVITDDITEAYKKALNIIEEIISDLDDLFKEMKSFKTKRNVAKTVGITVNCIAAAAAVARAFLTGGLSVVPVLMITAVGTGSNVVTDIIDDSKTKNCIRKIENMLERLDDQMKKLQSLFNENAIEDSMKTHNLYRNCAAFFHFECRSDAEFMALCRLGSSTNVNGSTALAIVKVAESKNVASKIVGFVKGAKFAYKRIVNSGAKTVKSPATAAKAVSVGKIIGKGLAVTGAVCTAWEVADHVKSLTTGHPSLKAINSVRSDLRLQQSELKRGLEEFQNILATARNTTMEAIIPFLEMILGGGYRKTSDSTFTPLTFSEFIAQIGRGTQGGIYHLMFMAEMKVRTIEIFDKTSDRSLRRYYGTGHLKIDPFVPIYTSRFFGSGSSISRFLWWGSRLRDPIRIEMIGKEGAHHYRPLTNKGIAIELKDNPTYANSCLFDAIAYQLHSKTDKLISDFQAYIRNNPIAQELYKDNIQEVFPEFKCGAQLPKKDSKKGKPVSIISGIKQGNQRIVTAIVRHENLGEGSAANYSAHMKIVENGIRDWDHAGHIIANMLGGDGGNLENIEPMHWQLNVGPCRRYELNIRHILLKHPTWTADISVIITYDTNPEYSERPTMFGYTVKFFDANGKLQEKHENDFINGLPDKPPN